ncbi:hypothetical protein ACHQM5_025763 [Ranunculus cassubicifolius]
MLRNKEDSPQDNAPSKLFNGLHFVLHGFDPIQLAKVRSKLVSGGGVDLGQYGPRCTHLIVGTTVYDDSACVVARADGKTVISSLWVDHCIDVGMLIDASSVLYRPVKDLNGIPGAKSLSICLTGYQRQDRDDIMRMVGLMGANFSKPLVANKVTHLICYKFEGEKYDLARKLKKIKLVNHHWLEDCLRAWEIVPESKYNKSGYELEIMEAEAKDSEEDPEDNRSIKIENATNSVFNLQSYDGTGSKTAEGSEMPMAVNQIGTPKKILPGDTRDNSNVNNLTRSPMEGIRSDHIPEINDVVKLGEGSTHRGTKACGRPTVCKEPLELSSNLAAANRTYSDAAAKSVLSYTWKTPGRSPLSTFSNPQADSEQGKVKEGIEVSPAQLDQLKSNLESGKNEDVTKDWGFHTETEKIHTLSLKKKASLSTASFKSPGKVGAMGSPSASDVSERLMITPSSGSNPSANLPQARSLKKDKNSLNMGLPSSSRTPSSDGTEFSTDIKTTWKKTPETSDLGPEQSKSSTKGKDMYSTKKTDPGEKVENIMDPSLGFGNLDSDNSRSSVDLELQKGSKIDTPTKKTVTKKKSLGSKSKLSSVSNKQKGSLGLGKRKMTDACEEKRVELAEPSSKAETFIGKSDPMDVTFDKRDEAAFPSKDEDETEAPDEEIGVSLENGARDVAIKKGLEVEPNSEVGTKSHLSPKEKSTVILDKDANEVVKEDSHKSDVGGGSVLKGKTVKGKKYVSSKSKKTPITAAEKIDKHGKDEEVNPEKVVDNVKAVARGKQRKLNPLSLEKFTNGEDDWAIENGRKTKDNKSETSAEDKKVREPVKGPNKGKPETAQAKSRSTSVLKAEKKQIEEEEKENNKPAESAAVAGNKHKRESIGAKLKRATTTQPPVYKEATKRIKAARKEPASFILSGHRLQRKEFQKMIKCLKGRVCRDSHTWSYQATHLIVPDPIKRTEKFFAAAASGRWILKSDYLTASNKAGKLLAEGPYEWFKKGFNEDGAINLEAPRKWRLLRERTGHGAFYGMRILIYGECIAPSLDTLKRVVKAGDGVILATSPPYTKSLETGVDYAVVSPGMPRVDAWVQEFLRHQVPCVAADYLVEYVCKAGCSLERHVLYETHAWAEKSFANLLSRSEEVVEEEVVEVDDNVDDITCQVCGSRDRPEVMLICGDETGSLGCGVGTHIDCCDPPLESVPEEDWFCSKCSGTTSPAAPKKAKKGLRKKQGSN